MNAAARRLCLAALLAAGTALLAADYHVATDGSDDGPGSAQRPFRSIHRAADALRPGDRCIVHAGVYRETVRLRASGTPEKPIRLMARPGDTVVLSGTEPLEGEWTRFRGSTWRLPTRKVFPQVFVGGRLMTEARWPNMPFEKRWDRDAWRPSARGTRYGTMVDPALAATGIDWTGAVATLNVGSWQTFRRIVRSHRAGSDRFTYDRDEGSRLAGRKPHRPGFDRYFLAGKLEALDSPGEWFLDRERGLLYLWPPDGRRPASGEVEVKTRPYALVAKGIRHVQVSGLHFFATTFKFEDAEDCSLDGLHLLFPSCVAEPFGEPVRRDRAPDEPREWASRRWFGETSVVTPTYLGGRGNTLANSSIRYANGTSLVVHGTRNTIENCLIHDIDWYGLDTGLGVDLLGTSASAIRYCTIFNIGSSEGIRLTNRGATIVEYNYIHHGGLCQSDGALVQAATPGVAGTVVRYNWLHDHNAFNAGGNGIRGDDRTRGLIVHHNVAWNCREKGIITKGDRNRVYNNTCLDNPAIDILVPWRRLPRKTDELEVQNTHSEVINNCARKISGRYKWERKTEPPPGKLATNYQGDDPMLADPRRLDFRPRPGSPLIDAGTPIPGITDGFRGKAPDIGAYEFGAERWVPGYRNALWVLPAVRGVRILLAMPPLEPVDVDVAGGGGAQPAARLTFTPENWCVPQTVALTDAARGQPLRLAIGKVQFQATIEPAKLDPIEGAKLRFRSIP